MNKPFIQAIVPTLRRLSARRGNRGFRQNIAAVFTRRHPCAGANALRAIAPAGSS